MKYIPTSTPEGKIPFLLRWVFPVLLLAIPFSLEVGENHRLNLISEPLIFIIAFLLLFSIRGRDLFRFLSHPLSVVIILYMFWMGVTIPFSSQPLVSLKYFIVTAAHVWVFFVGFWFYHRNNKDNLGKWITYYGTSLALILIYALYNHAHNDFRPDTSMLSARPFYFDHALYGVAISMIIFPVGILAYRAYRDHRLSSKWRKYLHTAIFITLAMGLYISFSRATWVSVLVSCLMLGLFWLGYKSKRMLAFLLFGSLTLGFVSYPTLQEWVASNKMESKTGGIKEQLLSITNITSDVSNLERINRYSCAWRMFLDKPVTGFGAGTYQSAYLPYQRREEMTRISVTSAGIHPPGKGGGAHSEYLQVLSELGAPGFILWILMAVLSIGYALRSIFVRSRIRFFPAAILGGLLAFYVQGMFNNFLHQDKVSVLFWSILAFIVISDMDRHQRELVHS